MKVGLPLMKNVHPKSVLMPLRLTPAIAPYAGVHKEILISGTSGSRTRTLIKLKEEMKDIIKGGKSREDSCVLIKGVRWPRYLVLPHPLTHFEIQ